MELRRMDRLRVSFRRRSRRLGRAMFEKDAPRRSCDVSKVCFCSSEVSRSSVITYLFATLIAHQRVVFIQAQTSSHIWLQGRLHRRNTMRGRARSYCYLSNDREAFMRSPLPMRNLNPFYLSQFSFGRETASVNNISSSMSTLPTASETLRDAVLPRGRTLVKGHTLSTVGPRML
ncbi:hypothetical protein RB195_014141 [Necator americanus]|uniref:Uncharacterized protein n=1 Tax=Necator americanus TaxID=51031 RepID=A0ABR1E1J5_NECAM